MTTILAFTPEITPELAEALLDLLAQVPQEQREQLAERLRRISEPTRRPLPAAADDH